MDLKEYMTINKERVNYWRFTCFSNHVALNAMYSSNATYPGDIKPVRRRNCITAGL